MGKHILVDPILSMIPSNNKFTLYYGKSWNMVEKICVNDLMTNFN